MSEHTQQVKEVTKDGIITNTTKETSNDEVEPIRDEKTSIIARIIWYIAGVLLVLLAFRFVFVLLGANPVNSFANFIYTTSHPFVSPFFGLFGYSIRYGVSRVELSTLVAMAVYAIVALGMSKALTIKGPFGD